MTYPVDALVSYYYHRLDRQMGQVVRPGHLRLIADSGAYSAMTQGARIELAAYADWVHRWRPHLLWVASLDVIGDPVATRSNWERLAELGLQTVPTVHLGTGTEWIDAYAADGVDYIGLGGLVGKQERSLPWLVRMFRHARDHHPHLRFHLWGCVNRKFLAALPAYSADSSGILGEVHRYGRLILFDPATNTETTISMSAYKRAIRYRDPKYLGHAHRPLLAKYGLTPEQVLDSGIHNRLRNTRVTIASFQQLAAHLQRRHHVSPPTWGIQASDHPGPRLHVIGNNGNRQGDLALLAPEEGPRLHLVASGPSSSTTQDLHQLHQLARGDHP